MTKAAVTTPMPSDVCAFRTFQCVRERHAGAFFFESANSIGESAALSVIGVGPTERLEGPVFAALRALEIAAVAGDVPYSAGGVFGCVGYDSIAELEPKLANRGTFAVGAGVESHVFFARDLIVFDHLKKLVHFVGTAADFASCLQACRAEDVVHAELSAERLTASLGRAKFFEGVQTLKDHIRDGDIFQAVLAERFECDVDVSAIHVFAALRAISPTPYSFFFNFGSCEFFGASPEALLKVEGGRLRTHPIAGTRPRGETEAQDRLMKRQLERSRKEGAEHLMLVDLARNDLGRVARTGSVEVNFYRSVQKFSNVMHLVSEVDADLDAGRTAIDALKACFPAGTLSGAPKFRAMELIAGIEKVPRGFYGGAVIGFDPQAQRLDSCIAIRSLEVREGKAILRAGAGIVADSKPDFEYAEIAHKLKPLRQAISSVEKSIERRG